MSEKKKRLLHEAVPRPRATPLPPRPLVTTRVPSPPRDARPSVVTNPTPSSRDKTPTEGDIEMPTTLPMPRSNSTLLPSRSADAERESAANPRQLEALGVYKSYRKGSVVVPVLRNLSITVREGEFLAIVGQSGSGKSTLLHLLGTLDGPDQGEIHFEGRRIDDLPRPQRDELRNKCFGMVFQFYHLLPELTALENVLSPLMIGEGVWSYLRHRRRHREFALRLLTLVGLGHRLKHKPRELSGGEMQRAAIARALVTNPTLLLADEPTGNLDQTTGQEILHLLRTLNDRAKLTIVMVTHDPALARQADRIVRLAGGRIEA
jgi:lipoprotein-releasing system ATP-binding protein